MPFAALPNAILFAVAGLLVFGAGAALAIRILPSDLWRRATEEQDVAAAIVVAAILVGVAWITASAVH